MSKSACILAVILAAATASVVEAGRLEQIQPAGGRNVFLYNRLTNTTILVGHWRARRTPDRMDLPS